MRRYLETLLRLKGVFIIPALTIPIIAVVIVLYTGQVYQVSASIWVQPSDLLDPVAFTRVTPNKIEGQALRERLETESFRQEIMDRVGLTEAIEASEWPTPSPLHVKVEDMGWTEVPVLRSVLGMMGLTLPDSVDGALSFGLSTVKDSIAIVPDGNNLLRIAYIGKEPDLGKRLIDEIIALYNEKTIEIAAEEAQLSIDFYAEQAQLRDGHLQESNDALQQFLTDYPDPIPGQTRAAFEVAQLSSLQRSHTLEQTLYEGALRKLEQVRIDAEAGVTNRNQSFKVIDPPVAPDSAGITTKAISMVVVVGIFMGVAVGGFLIIMLTWLDHTVRTKEDFEDVLTAPLVALVPSVSFGRRRKVDLLRAALARQSTHSPHRV